MLVDGKKIAADIYAEIRETLTGFDRAPRLTIVTCAPNFETQKYLTLKEQKARDVGIETDRIVLPSTSTTNEFVREIEAATAHSDGIIVQLPLPVHIDTTAVLLAIPRLQDVDALRPDTMEYLSPVAGSIRKILQLHKVSIVEKFVTIIGSGRLVGIPVYQWFVMQGAHVSVVTRDTQDIAQYTKQADIIVCGAGVPGLLTPLMIKDGVVILDAGTSEDGGVLKGDTDPECALKASLFTPVPGGIGPVTIAILLQNVVDCAVRKGTVL